jgi:hypothetical protein
MLNRHDIWLRFYEGHKETLGKTGLPTEITRAEHRFRDLLGDGSVEIRGQKTTLEDLDANQWLAFQKFVDVFFLEFESCMPMDLFPAFRRKSERRRSV